MVKAKKSTGAKGKKGPAKTKPTITKQATKPTLTRIGAIAQVMQKGASTKTDIINKADALYTKQTGRPSNSKETLWAYVHAIRTLRVFGYVEVNGDKIQWREK